MFRGASALAPPGPDRHDAIHRTPSGSKDVVADPVLLFRFSAVTNNAHRIHYDHPYATTSRATPTSSFTDRSRPCCSPSSRAVTPVATRDEISFRARAPHFANRPLWLTGHADPDGTIHTAAIRADHTEAMTLDAR